MATTAHIVFAADEPDLDLADSITADENVYNLYYIMDGAGFSYRYMLNQYVPATPTTVIPWHRIHEVLIAQ